jgi:hypothetical protein
MKEFAASSYGRKAALAAALIMALPISPAGAQGSAVRIVPGFEKVYGDLKKKEAEQQKEFARADAEKAAAETQRMQGEKLILDSDALIESHRVAYQTLTAQMGRGATSGDVRAEAKALEDLSKLWGRAEDDRMRGEKLVRNSQKDMLASEERRAKASRKIAEIRAAMTRTYVGAAAPDSIDAAPARSSAPIGSEISEASLPPAPDVVETAPGPSPAAAPSSDLDAKLLGGSAPAQTGAPLKSD